MSESPLQPTPFSPAEPSPPAAPPPTALEYDRSGNHVTRGQFRILLILMFINTVAIVGYLCVPGGTQWARQTWKDFETKRAAKAAEKRKVDTLAKRIGDFRKTLPAITTMKLSGDTPVYTEDGIEAASLLASDPAYQTVRFERRGIDLSQWQVAVGRGQLPQILPLYGFVGTDSPSPSSRGISVFVHARRNPAGEERLVLCELDASQQVRSIESDGFTISTERALVVRLIAPGSGSDPPKLLSMVRTEFNQRPDEQANVRTKDSGRDGRNAGDASAVKTPQTFRLMTGVADPSDATRFTIPYFMNGARGVFAVRIAEVDRLIVEPSDGRIAERNGTGARITQMWDPSAQPALRVSESRP